MECFAPETHATHRLPQKREIIKNILLKESKPPPLEPFSQFFPRVEQMLEKIIRWFKKLLQQLRRRLAPEKPEPPPPEINPLSDADYEIANSKLTTPEPRLG
ncbi:MAG: hypothetical protein F6J93_27640 [Oscillatoria sp. SIO1A7]|nr:hypothetical protein [Oscillatoria sp. SIO1A7]